MLEAVGYSEEAAAVSIRGLGGETPSSLELVISKLSFLGLVTGVDPELLILA